MTPLYLACSEGRYDIAQLLLNSNADPNTCNKVSIYCEYKRLLHVTRFRSGI